MGGPGRKDQPELMGEVESREFGTGKFLKRRVL